MLHIIVAALLTLLAPSLTTAQPVALPLPVTVVSVELEGCAEVMQSTASCPLLGATGTALLTNPGGRVEMTINGSATGSIQVRGQAVTLTLEIEVPADAERVAMEVTQSSPRPPGTDDMQTGASFSTGLTGSSAIFGDGFQIVPSAGVGVSEPELQGRRRVAVLPELAPGDTVRLPMFLILSLQVPFGGSTVFDETAVLEFKYLPAPEPPAESSLGAAIAFLLALKARRRRLR